MRMKYLNSYKIFEKGISSLLELDDNVDNELINKISGLLNRGKILEISCGNGSDSIKLKELGYNVVATDFNQEYVNHVNRYVKCIKHDTRDKFPFRDGEFDLVYSRLGLHYFNVNELNTIFREIHRITKKYLIFSVKIANDNLNTGKIILDKSQWEELVGNNFNIISSEVKDGILYGDKSRWLEITANK